MAPLTTTSTTQCSRGLGPGALGGAWCSHVVDKGGREGAADCVAPGRVLGVSAGCCVAGACCMDALPATWRASCLCLLLSGPPRYHPWSTPVPALVNPWVWGAVWGVPCVGRCGALRLVGPGSCGLRWCVWREEGLVCRGNMLEQPAADCNTRRTPPHTSTH